MRVLLGAIVGALIVFAVSALLHTVSPLGTMGFTNLPNEAAMLDTLRANVPASGLYMFPAEGMMGSEEQQKAWQANLAKGPYGLLVITTGPGEAMSPRQLILEFLFVFLAALIAGVILAWLGGSYGFRAVTVALLALWAFCSVSASHWIWYKYPTQFILAELIMELIAWLLAGLAMAKLIRPRVVPVT